MSPRPRKLSDAEILETAIQVVSRTGPDRLTLADVGEAVGLSAATLVQRFGSKQALLLAMFEQSVTLIDDRFAATVSSDQSPLDALYSAAMDRYRAVESPEIMSNRLAFLLLGLSDPQFHHFACTSAQKAVAGYKTMLDNAMEAGELAEDNLDTAQLGEAIHAMTLGSLTMWSIVRDGARRAQMTRNLDTLLGPYRSLRRARPSADSTAEPGTKPVAPPPLLTL